MKKTESLSSWDLTLLRQVDGKRSQLDIANILAQDDTDYGRHATVSRRVAPLRKRGYLRDVARDASGHALTRGLKNVPLYLTAKGYAALAAAA